MTIYRSGNLDAIDQDPPIPKATKAPNREVMTTGDAEASVMLRRYEKSGFALGLMAVAALYSTYSKYVCAHLHLTNEP